MSDLIINFTPTGMIPTKQLTPHVPITPDEIIKDVLKMCEIGITIVHLHVRNQDGTPSLDPDLYKRVIGGIREKEPDLVICVSCSGRADKELSKRLMPLTIEGDCKPDMGSLTLSSLNFNKVASLNAPDTIMALAQKMKDSGIKPELEIFDLGMANYMKYLIRKSLLTPPYYANLILGNIACAQSTPLHLGVVLSELPEETTWSVGGIGDSQLKMNIMSMICDGGVRVGLEDNVYFDENRTILASNFDLVERIHSIANMLKRPVMKPSTFRKIMGLNNG